MENAGNGISKPLDFKIFWGTMPPDPSSGSRLRRSRAPPTYITLATVLLISLTVKDRSVRKTTDTVYNNLAINEATQF